VAAAKRCADRVERVCERAEDVLGLEVGGALLDVARVRGEPLVIGRADVEAEDVDGLGLAAKARGQLL
jgi:hypothetical protein